MNQTELDQLMAASAQDAIATSQDEFDIDLDKSADSVALIDDLLLAFVDKYHTKVLEDSAVFTLCNIYGAYMGEVYKSIAGGNWRYDNSDPEAPYVLLDVGQNSYAFAGICYERLVNNNQVSVKSYFDQALANHMQ
jgi:hypothetical protein